MELKRIEFIKSIAAISDYKSGGMPEIAIAGRSNVGKSSFINMMGRNKSLARVSETPGKTRMINIFNVNREFSLMDLPGYGYAKVSASQKQKFSNLIEQYFNVTEDLVNVLLLLDMRHEPSKDDMQMLQWLYAYSIPFTIIATKMDQVPKSQRPRQINMLVTKCGVTHQMIIPTSSKTGEGRDAVLKRFSEILAPR